MTSPKPISTIGTYSRLPILKLLSECISSGSRNRAEELPKALHTKICENLFINPLSILRVIPEAVDELSEKFVRNFGEILLDIS
jgi:hypothetical protein